MSRTASRMGNWAGSCRGNRRLSNAARSASLTILITLLLEFSRLTKVVLIFRIFRKVANFAKNDINIKINVFDVFGAGLDFWVLVGLTGQKKDSALLGSFVSNLQQKQLSFQ